MSGVPLPVMSKREVVTRELLPLPVAMVGEYFQKSREDIARAVALSQLFPVT